MATARGTTKRARTATASKKASFKSSTQNSCVSSSYQTSSVGYEGHGEGQQGLVPAAFVLHYSSGYNYRSSLRALLQHSRHQLWIRPWPLWPSVGLSNGACWTLTLHLFYTCLLVYRTKGRTIWGRAGAKIGFPFTGGLYRFEALKAMNIQPRDYVGYLVVLLSFLRYLVGLWRPLVAPSDHCHRTPSDFQAKAKV